MKITVIGSVVKDVLLPYHGGKVQSLGGIYFTLIHLSAICRDNDIIMPITYVGKDIYNDFIRFIEKQKNISYNSLVEYNKRNNLVILEYVSDEERTEISKFPLPSIPFTNIKPYLDSDFLIINMISGWDINLSTFKKIRNAFPGKIYLDIHSYLLGRKKNGQRFYRKPDDFQMWFELADYIQFNEREFNILNDENLSLENFFLKYCISEGKLINLTLGANGSKSVYRCQGKIKTIISKPHNKVKLKDPTGCGDAFMAGFIYGIRLKMKIKESLELANYIAGINCEYVGAPEIDSLKLKLKQMQII